MEENSVLSAVTVECDEPSEHVFNSYSCSVIEKIYQSWKTFHDAPVSQSGTYFIAWSITRRIHQILVDGVDDFAEVESDKLYEIRQIRKNKLNSYHQYYLMSPLFWTSEVIPELRTNQG